MGIVLGVIAAVAAMTTGAAFAFSPPNRQNSTFDDIKARQKAEQAQKEAEEAARQAEERAEQIRQQADRDREEAQARQEEANRAAAQAAEEAERMRAQVEEVRNAARRAQERNEAAANAAREEAARFAQEAEEERERSQRMFEEAERERSALKEEAKKAQEAADEQLRKADASKAEAEKAARVATEEAQKAMKAKEEAEKRLKEGIRPVVTPTAEEVSAAKERIQYRDDRFHFAIAGISGSGKSSLVNAFRGLLSTDPGAAASGVTETTREMARYPDANPNHPFVWYDIPGAGTLNCPDWQYFNDQGLYVFDFIIVLFDSRFTATDIAILENASRFNIPTYIVRSKADQHIRNMMNDMGYDSDEDRSERDRLYETARKRYVEQTQRNVRENLASANLPNQRVYIVSNKVMANIVGMNNPKKMTNGVEAAKEETVEGAKGTVIEAKLEEMTGGQEVSEEVNLQETIESMKLQEAIDDPKLKKKIDEVYLLKDLISKAYARRYSAGRVGWWRRT